MTLLDEWHFLVSALRLHIADVYPSRAKPLTPRKSEPLPPPPSLPVPSLPAPSSPVPSPPVKKQAMTPAPEIKKQPQNLPPAPPIEIPNVAFNPVMQALCRPYSAPTVASLQACIDALEKLGVSTTAAPQEKTKDKEMSLVFVSFFPPGSKEDQFVQKVYQAVAERLIPSHLYLVPALQAAADCLTLCAAKAVKGVILAYGTEQQAKLALWLAQFGQELQASQLEVSPLVAKRELFGTPFFELNLASSMLDDLEHKRALWTALQKIV